MNMACVCMMSCVVVSPCSARMSAPLDSIVSVVSRIEQTTLWPWAVSIDCIGSGARVVCSIRDFLARLDHTGMPGGREASLQLSRVTA